MQFGILGPVEARGDDGTSIAVGGPRVRALLALLLLDAGRTVTAERLIDGLYGDDPPSGAANALQSQVSRLRRGLGPAGLVEGRPAGYRLNVDPGDVDVHRFERLARAGRRALTGADTAANGPGGAVAGVRDAARAADLLREALGLWRGPALADLADVPFAGAQAARLEELRVAAAEDRAEAGLALGEHGPLVPGLRDLVAAHPLRERARALLMRALYGDGRQAEALSVYEDARRTLADELGADPSSELAGVHLAVLRGAPSAPEAGTGARAAGSPPPPARPLGVPAQLTSFVGREDELRRVGRMLAEGRLVTLLGPGGAGKTRLAIEAAGREDGEVCFVDLAPLGASSEVPKALLGALGLRESGMLPNPAEPPGPSAEARDERPRDTAERLASALAGRRMLLVLDNCEHVVEAVARLTHRLLGACPELRVLATSREALAITGEALRPLPPLALPPEGAAPDEASAYPAVRLFADRAAAVRPGFAVDEVTLAAVLQICAALDGLPLAIELAAARLRSLPVTEVAARLDDRFRLLSRGNRTAAPRHQTLRAVVEWSWGLLGEDEQTLARRLTVFAGGLTRESAEGVCGLPPYDTDELLAGLVDKSLVQTDGVRYRMLDTVRAFCAEQLAEAGETERLERAHAAYFLDLARRADPELRGAAQLEWLERLAAEHANLHMALRRSVHTHPVFALHLVAALTWYWWLRGRIEGAPLAITLLDRVGLDPPEGLEEEYILCVTNALSSGFTGARSTAWLDRATTLLEGIDRTLRYPSTLVLWALTAGPPRTDPTTLHERHIGADPWSQALIAMSEGFMQQYAGDVDGAEAACATALARFRATGDRWGMANTLDSLAQIRDWRGDRERSLELLDEALRLTGELGALEDTADLLCRRGEVYVHSGDLAAAEADYEQAIVNARQAGTPDKVGAGRCGLGNVARHRGDLAGACALYESALTGFASKRFIAAAVRLSAQVGLGWIAAAEGDAARARAMHRAALKLTFDHPVFMYRAATAVGMAGVALLEGDGERAALLIGASTAMHGIQVPGDPDAVRVAAAARALIGDGPFEAARSRGAALPAEDAFALVIDESSPRTTA
ncbi:BTAD domain-containing putative transcriptional regulator [Actinomadura xylanilytica]|uniref:BTAD domain-containing putative transcriptional regulator n=1 Tax=Actinomadura xylanilytica TaxID=887459 RepID=UPI00255A783C|nr:BTAD domain-containing putative transcriptional regulator [Actinomadura xylanilytica]MDL4774554.1 BTAD domain-containing putative transcriptional regulator [Actinomadura xylanilytica]